MGRKRKAAAPGDANVEASASAIAEAEPPRKRTLTGLKDAPQEEQEERQQPVFRNKEKTLIVCSRSITYRYRHLMMDIFSLLPHSKRDVKLQAKDNKTGTLTELADLKSCSSSVYFECRKKKDLYMWLSKFPDGPSAKFLVKAVHTTAELKLTGNHLKGSRPILTFSAHFDSRPHLQLLKELLTQVFGTPKDHRKSKPFYDHVIVFSVLDNHIWFRNYQISVAHHGTDKLDRSALDKMTLIEVGPRFCLNPIKIFSGSFGGRTLYENPMYMSPNLIRSIDKRKTASSYKNKVKAKKSRRKHLNENQMEPDEFTGMWRDQGTRSSRGFLEALHAPPFTD